MKASSNPTCWRIGDAAAKQNHWRMVLRAEALVCVAKNEHLVRAAESVGLPVYEVER